LVSNPQLLETYFLVFIFESILGLGPKSPKLVLIFEVKGISQNEAMEIKIIKQGTKTIPRNKTPDLEISMLPDINSLKDLLPTKSPRSKRGNKKMEGISASVLSAPLNLFCSKEPLDFIPRSI
jgi:hypothetical protein